MRAKPAEKRGYIFIASMIALTVMLILGVVSIQVSKSTGDVAARARYDSEALMLAQAGAESCEAWLRGQGELPPKNKKDDPFYYPSSAKPPTNVYFTMSNGTYFGYGYTIPNPFDVWSNYYVITGVGTTTNGYTRKVSEVLRPQSFSLYGYFEDTGLGNNWWVAGISKFDGPFHTNGTLQIDWKKTGATSNDIIFHGTAESSSSGVNWGNSGAPTTTAHWNSIFDGGRAAMALSVEKIDFPPNSSDQLTASQNGLTTSQLSGTSWSSGVSQPDVYMTTNGSIPNSGIYINNGGQANCNVSFSVASGGQQVVTITHQVRSSTSTWVTKITEITVDQVANTTKKRTNTNSAGWTTPVSYSGVPNGVVYCNGNITSLDGQLADTYVANSKIVRANNWTVATDIAASKNVTITNNITYKTPPDFTKPMTDVANLKCPALGVFCNQILVSTACPNDLTLHGVFMASSTSTSGSMLVQDIAAKKLRGNLYILGGTIMRTAAILGQYNTSTKTTQYGYNEHYSYDPRMATGPLTAFPKTSQYDVVSWQFQ